MLDAVIFDMDGVLIDSEPFWQDAEIAAFAEIGFTMHRDQCRETTGLRIDEVITYWWRRLEGRLPLPDPADFREAIMSRMIEAVRTRGEAMAGVRDLLNRLEAAGIPMALASSSDMALIDAVVDGLALRRYFRVLHSAEHEARGKPHPAVYLSTAERLGVDPRACLAIEDSINGVVAAKAATMACLAVPEPNMREDRRFGIADRIVASLTEVTADLLVELGVAGITGRPV